MSQREDGAVVRKAESGVGTDLGPAVPTAGQGDARFIAGHATRGQRDIDRRQLEPTDDHHQ